MLRMKRFALVCLAALAFLGGRADGAFEQICENWEGARPGAKAGDAVDRDGATVTDPQVTSQTADGGKMAAAFNFTFTPVPAVQVLEAEKARLSGPARYKDVLAWGGSAVSGLGARAGSAITFDNVPTTNGLTVFYNHTTPYGWREGMPTSTTQCGLYVDDKRVATLKFNDPGGWFTPFDAAVYEGKIGGAVKLMVDAGDFAANRGGPCCNVDRVVVGPPHLLPSIEVRLKVDTPPLEPGMAWFNCAIRAPKGFCYQVGLEDGGAVHHWSRPNRQQRDGGWEHITIALSDLKPRLAPPKADPAKGGRIKAILIRATGDEAGLRGMVAVDEARFSEGWPSNPPAGAPLPRSTAFAGIRLTGRHQGYAGADTWRPTWAADGNLYSPFSDGVVGDAVALAHSPNATTGMARIEGEDPLSLKVTPLGTYLSRPWPYSARYPCASLLLNGVWYYGTCIVNHSGPDGSGLSQGPFVGFRTSKDFGKTWTETPHTPLHNLFGEEVDLAPGGGLTRIKMGSPQFVDFGKNMEHSPDGKACLVASGCTRTTSPQTWFRGDEIYLARVAPSPDTINNAGNYEFYAGLGAQGEALWSRNFAEMRPLLSWPGHTGSVSITWDAPLKKYLMCVSTGEYNTAPFDTCILEADKLGGPWRLVTYMEQFGKQAYGVNIPSKFISADGRRMWLCYSANPAGHPQNPPGSYYALCFQEVELVAAPAPVAAPTPAATPAPTATPAPAPQATPAPTPEAMQKSAPVPAPQATPAPTVKTAAK